MACDLVLKQTSNYEQPNRLLQQINDYMFPQEKQDWDHINVFHSVYLPQISISALTVWIQTTAKK